MAENNSSAPLKTAEGAATLWCVHVTGADDVHPMPSREVALEEANALNTSICRIKRQDIDPVLIAVVAEWPHSADSHAAGLMIRDECLRMRGDQALAAQAAPAAVAVPEITDAMVDAYLAEQRRTVEEADRFGRSNIGGLHTNTVRDACRNGLRAALATPALPATEDSSAGDLAAVQAEPVAWRYKRRGDCFGDFWFKPAGQSADDLRTGRGEGKVFARCQDHYDWTPLYTAPQAQPADALDAARWRALLACGRIRLFGTAGVNGSGIHDPSQLDTYNQPYGNYVHFGAEFWSTFPDQDYYNTKENPVYARATLTEFADACRAAMAAAQEGGKA